MYVDSRLGVNLPSRDILPNSKTVGWKIISGAIAVADSNPAKVKGVFASCCVLYTIPLSGLGQPAGHSADGLPEAGLLEPGEPSEQGCIVRACRFGPFGWFAQLIKLI